MVMTVCVYINGRQIAEASAQNVSNLEDISNYECDACERSSPYGAGFYKQFRVEQHPRQQSCWALVGKIAAAAITNGKDQ